MAITDVSVKWTEIGCSVLSESDDSSTRKVSRLFAPLIKYDDRKNKKAYCFEINKDDFVDNRMDAFKTQFPAVYERMQKCNLIK